MTAGNMVGARGQCLLLATFPILASIWFNTGSEETHSLFLSTVNHCSSCQALIVFCLCIVEMDAVGASFSTDRLPVRQLGGKLEVNAPLDGRAAASFSPSAGHTAYFHQH